MRWSAVSGSALVHIAGVAAALVSAQSRILYAHPAGGIENTHWPTWGGGPPAFPRDTMPAVDSPQIYLAAGQSTRLGFGQAPGPMLSAGDIGCPRQRPLDAFAAPDFPILATQGPFARIGKTPRSPSYCVLIGADGRVSALSVVTGSGDRHADRMLLRTIRGLAFRPAVRAGRSVAAWHRLVVNRGAGWLFDPNPHDVIVELPPMVPRLID